MLGFSVARGTSLLSATATGLQRTLAVRSLPVRVRQLSTASLDNIVKSPYGDIETPKVQLYECVWQNVDKFPDRIATECAVTGRRFTYAEARTSSRNLAAVLVRAGLAPSAVVLVLLPNCPEFPIVVLAVNEAGLVTTTCNNKYTTEEISRQVRDCRPSVLITTPELFGTASEAFRLAGLPAPRLAVTVRVAPDSPPTPSGVADLHQLLQVPAGSDLPGRRRSPEDVAALPYSSGTTGLPKGVLLSNANLVANILQAMEPSQQVCQTIDGRVCTEDEVVPVLLPMFHIYGLTIIALQKFSMGAKLVTLPMFEPKSYLDAITKHKATVLYVVPPMLLFLGRHPSVSRNHLDTVRYVVTGGAPAGKKDISRFLEKASPNTNVLQGYGLTETSPMLLHLERNSENWTSVGKPVRGTSVKIVDLENGCALGPNETGELCVKGPQVMLGYLNNPEATAETVDCDGWLHTGDFGYYDGNLDFYIVDRLKELIKVKGFQVPPLELEEILRTHPAVEDAAVVAIPHKVSGEVPKAYVVIRQGVKEPITEQQLAKFVETKVADYKRLVGGVEFISAIPKTPSGKILRQVLKKTGAA